MSQLAIITGASKGLGNALLSSLIELDDFDFVVISRGEGVNYDHPRVRHKAIDLGSPQEFDWLSAMSSNYDKVVFFNNAGRIQPIGEVGGFGLEEILSGLTINLLSPLAIINELLSVPDQNLTILNITSGAAKRVIQGWALYSVGKSGVLTFMDHLRDIPNVTVADIDPGVLDTDMQAAIRATDKARFPDLEVFGPLHDQGQLKNPQEVAQEIIRKHLGK